MISVKQVTEAMQRRFPRWLASIRAKITLPYVLLAVALALGGAFIVTRLVVESAQERFIQQLLESGRLVADRIVGIEEENLAVLRPLARTEGLAEAVEQRDQATLDQLAFPIVVNGGADAVDILDRTGTSLLALHHVAGGGPADYDRAIQPLDWNEYSFVQKILQEESDGWGDKFSGLVDAPWGNVLYAAGPIFQGDTLVGVILVGRYLEGLPNDLRQASAAHQVSLYTLDGIPLGTTFPSGDLEALHLPPEEAAQVLAEQDEAVQPRSISLGGRTYKEVLGPLEIREGGDVGLFGAALAETYIVQAGPITQAQLIIFVAGAFLAVIFVGTLVAQRISHPIVEVARASRRVAAGDLDQRVVVRTRDEVGDMAQAFNKMLGDLKQAQRVRDIFGRAVSPAVSHILIEAVRKGEVALTGESRVVTTLFTDIRDFTAFAESLPPDEVLTMLNEVLGTFISVIDKHEGVVNKFGGDSLLSIFGAPIHQPNHAHRAVAAGLEMAHRLRELNGRRQAAGLDPVRVGIGINTGEAVAGLTGSAERLEYTVIGDTVNVAARVQALNRQFEGRTLFITEDTLESLGSDHGLELEDLGELPLRGKAELVRVYAVRVPSEGEAIGAEAVQEPGGEGKSPGEVG